jgi:hypothetical protein
MKITAAQLVDLYTDYLIASVSCTTATEMSYLLDCRVSHDKITRLLKSGYINSRLLWHMAKPICEEIAMDDAVLIIDDSIEAKPYSDKSSLINWHFDHTVGRAVKGVNFITAHYHSWEMSIPVNVQFIQKDRTITDAKGKRKEVSSISKMQHFRNMVGDCAGKLSFRYVLSDSWYSSAENMKWVDDLDKYFIMAIKDNRKVALSLKDKLSGKYISIKEAVSEECVRSVYIEQLDFPILITKQVFKNGDGSTGTLYLAANDLNLTYEQMTTIYKKRWKVEEYHKSIKSNTAFPRSPAKTIVPQQSHFIASVMAYIKLERLKVRSGMNHFAMKSLLFKKASMAAWIELYKLAA